MNSLAQLIPPVTSNSPDHARNGAADVIFGGWRNDLSDGEHLQCFSDILLDVDDGGIYEALRRDLPFKWFEGDRYDAVNPFGDIRQVEYRALWTFDMENNLLIHVNRDGRRKIPLSLLLEQTVSCDDMQFFGPPFPQILQPAIMSEVQFWEPEIRIDERRRVFSHRLLRDFNHQWRHILRNEYNSKTLHLLATAAIKLSTLDFDIHEETGERLHNPAGKQEYVWITDLPNWEPFRSVTEMILVGNVYVTMCMSLEEGLSKAREHKRRQRLASHAYPAECSEPSYMILSVKHIMLCRITKDGTFECTKPELLLSGSSDGGHPSERALDYLIWGSTTRTKAVPTSLQSLPVEIQDMMLDYVSDGDVAARRIGCVFGIGSPFSWKWGSQDIRLQEVWKRRHLDSPVESQLRFNDHMVGLVYQAKRKN